MDTEAAHHATVFIVSKAPFIHCLAELNNNPKRASQENSPCFASGVPKHMDVNQDMHCHRCGMGVGDPMFPPLHTWL